MTLTASEFANLKVGDIVRGRSSRQEYIVTANYGGRVTAVKTVDLTNPAEWELVSQVTQRKKLAPIQG